MYILIAEVTGGTGNYEYSWTGTGEATPSITISNPDDGDEFIVVVNDDLGCTATDSTTVDIFDPEVIIQGDSMFCEGDRVTLSVVISGDTSLNEIFWVTPLGVDTNDIILAANEGIYTVIVENALGCSDSTSVFLQVHENPVVDLGPDTIYTESNVTLDAGSGFVTYTWNTGQATQTIIAGFTGWYYVIVTDNNGCSSEDSIFVEIITNVIETPSPGSIKIMPNPNSGEFVITGELQSPVEVSLKIWNALGELVYFTAPEKKDNHFLKKINLQKPGSGIYFVKINLGGKEIFEKVIVNY